MALTALMTAGLGIYRVTCQLVLQTLAPARIRGRVLAVFELTFWGIFSAGTLVAGVIADRAGPAFVAATFAGATLIGVAVLLVLYRQFLTLDVDAQGRGVLGRQVLSTPAGRGVDGAGALPLGATSPVDAGAELAAAEVLAGRRELVPLGAPDPALRLSIAQALTELIPPADLPLPIAESWESYSVEPGSCPAPRAALARVFRASSRARPWPGVEARTTPTACPCLNERIRPQLARSRSCSSAASPLSVRRHGHGEPNGGAHVERRDTVPEEITNAQSARS